MPDSERFTLRYLALDNNQADLSHARQQLTAIWEPRPHLLSLCLCSRNYSLPLLSRFTIRVVLGLAGLSASLPETASSHARRPPDLKSERGGQKHSRECGRYRLKWMRKSRYNGIVTNLGCRFVERPMKKRTEEGCPSWWIKKDAEFELATYNIICT